MITAPSLRLDSAATERLTRYCGGGNDVVARRGQIVLMRFVFSWDGIAAQVVVVDLCLVVSVPAGKPEDQRRTPPGRMPGWQAVRDLSSSTTRPEQVAVRGGDRRTEVPGAGRWLHNPSIPVNDQQGWMPVVPSVWRTMSPALNLADCAGGGQ